MDNEVESDEADGIKKHEKKSFEMQIKIPNEDTISPDLDDDLTDEQKSLLRAFASTINGDIVQVTYFLKVNIKYDAWNCWGEGPSKQILIEILQPPKQIYTDSQSYSNWDPVVHPSVTLAEPDSE